MKAFYFLIPLFMANACKSPAGPVISSEKPRLETMDKTSTCPEDGTCKIVLHKNKKLQMIIDDATASAYPVMTDGKDIVVEYTYFRKGPEGTADGNYTETIQFEIPANTQNFVKEDSALSDVNMVFGKQGNRNSGYYPITDGKLIVSRSEKKLNIDLKFKQDKTSQVISTIRETVKI